MPLSREERAALARASRANATALRDEPLPARDTLAELTFDEMMAVLASYGVVIDEERLDVEVRAALATDLLAINRGDPLDANRVEELAKRSKRVVASQARSLANQTIGDMRQQAILDADPRPVDEQWLMWMTVSSKDKCCPDCHDRHGIIARLDWWEAAGMPRDGMTVCRGNCRCRLTPVGAPKGGESAEGKRAS